MVTTFYQPNWGKGQGIYAASRLAELRTAFEDEDLISHELRRHEVMEPIPEIKGWLPRWDFINAEFTLENEIKLIEFSPVSHGNDKHQRTYIYGPLGSRRKEV